MGLFDRSLLLANPQAWEKLVDPVLFLMLSMIYSVTWPRYVTPAIWFF